MGRLADVNQELKALLNKKIGAGTWSGRGRGGSGRGMGRELGGCKPRIEGIVKRAFKVLYN